MSLTNDDSNLGMLLPIRSGMELADYLRFLLVDFPDSLPFADTKLCGTAPAEAIVLSTDPDDHGHPYRFLGCDLDTQDLILEPERLNLLGENVYRRALLCIEAEGQIFLGLSAFKYRHQGNWLFAAPAMLYRRRTRHDKRVRIDGQIVLRYRDGRTILARLHDFSPSGASFFTDVPLPIGETLLAEFEVLDCGTCETVVTAARCEHLAAGAPYRYLVGVKMQLTATQRKKAEQLYLCKKAEQMKHVVDSARSRNR